MVIVIFKVRTRARLKKPLEERRNLSGKNAHLAYQFLLELLSNNKHGEVRRLVNKVKSSNNMI
jgi:hypothetical protein